MIYNNTSVKSIIAKVYTDLDLQEENHRESDFIEWAGEAMSKIRAFYTFTIKVTGREGIPFIELSNHQAKLPSDLYGIVGVAYCDTKTGNFKPLRYGSGSFDPRIKDEAIQQESSTVPSTQDVIQYTMYVYDLSYSEALELLNTDQDVKDRMETLVATSKDKDNTIYERTEAKDDYYTINSSYIRTNKKNGYLMLAYTAIPIDQEGYPLIPDDEGFREAVYWYIVKKYLYPKWVVGEVRDRVYYDAQNSWNFYCKQAYANAMMPNVDQLESLKNKWLELVPEINDWNNFFNTSGERQRIYI